MKKTLEIVLLFLMFMLFISCVSIEAVTFVDGTVYTNSDAYVAYDVYYELYDNGIIENKPIFIRK